MSLCLKNGLVSPPKIIIFGKIGGTRKIIYVICPSWTKKRGPANQNCQIKLKILVLRLI